MQLQSGKSMLIEAAVLIYKLEDGQLYSPWQVAATGYDRNSHRQDYDRIRLNLGEWSRYHNIRETFENRDDQGQRKGRFPAWYGKTWKEHLGHKDLEAAKRWIAQENRRNQPPSPVVESETPCPAATAQDNDSVHQVSRPKRSRWALALLPLTAAAALFLYLPGSQPTPLPPGPAPEIETKVERPQTPTNLSVAEFTASRMEARLQRKPVRAKQFMHPPIEDLTWDMTLIDSPILDQATIMPNCVFLVSRTHRDMMPFTE